MKKFLALTITILMLLLYAGCSSDTDSWQTVVIEDCGTIKIPSEWSFYTQDEIIYIMYNDKPIMTSYNRTDEPETNAYFTDFKYIDFITSAVLSNSVIYGKAKYLYSGNEIERYYLDLCSKKDVEFIVWDTGITKDFLVKIANTFILE